MSTSLADPTTLRVIPLPLPQSPFTELLQFGRLELGKGCGRLEIAIQERHLRPLGIMHGGVMASIIDSIIGMAAGTLAPPDHHGVTVQLSVNFIRPVWLGETIIATSEIQHAGRQTAVGRADVHTKEGILAASGTGTFMFLPHTDQTRHLMPKLDDKEIMRPR